MASIRQNPEADALPDFRNLGVIARALVAVNLLSFGAILADKPVLAHSAEAFVCIHRNCLVPRAAIRGFERAGTQDDEPHWEVMLEGLEEQLPVSRRQWQAVRELLAENKRG